jgi:hypothetical protein
VENFNITKDTYIRSKVDIENIRGGCRIDQNEIQAKEI